MGLKTRQGEAATNMPLTALPFLRRGKNALGRKEFPHQAENLPERSLGERSETKNTAWPAVRLRRFKKATVQISQLHHHSLLKMP
jgi:hypothetical protein